MLQVSRLLFAIPLAAMAVVLGACGSDTISLDPVASAATKTEAAGSSRVDFTIAMKVDGESVEMTGTGAFDYRELRGSLTYYMQLPEVGHVRMEMRMIGMKMYMRMPAGTGEALPQGKEWIGLDLDKALDQMGMSGLDLTGQQDPAKMLQYLRSAGVDVREDGSASVRGVETKRYVGEMDFQKALEAGLEDSGLTKEEQKRARDGMSKMLEQLESATIPIEVFIGDDDLVRRITMKMDMAIEGERLDMSMTMDYFDFGVDVEVEAPPAASVMDLTQALRP
jgi:hypothetical protein